MAGATNPTLSLTNIQSVNAGLYNVFVTNAFGAATSQTARLTFKVANLSMAKAGGPAPNLPGVNISGVAGELYGIQVCSNLAPPVNWVGLTNILLPQANYTWYDRIPRPGSKSFIASSPARRLSAAAHGKPARLGPLFSTTSTERPSAQTMSSCPAPM